MKKHGFECALEWSNLGRLEYGSKSYNEFYKIDQAARKLFGCEWSKYVNQTGKFSSKREDSKTFARIYFRNEKYLTLVQLSL
jgi:hypothetical protein